MEDKYIYGSFGRRFLAWLFDALLLWLLPMFILFVVVATAANTNAFWLGLAWLAWEVILFQWIIVALYQVFTMYYFGASLGKKLGGMKIIKEDKSSIRFSDALMRFPVGYTVSSIFWWAGFFWILKDPRRRSFHDHIAGTLVITKARATSLYISLLMLIFVMIFLVFSILSVGTNRKLWTNSRADLQNLFNNISRIP